MINIAEQYRQYGASRRAGAKIDRERRRKERNRIKQRFAAKARHQQMMLAESRRAREERAIEAREQANWNSITQRAKEKRERAREAREQANWNSITQMAKERRERRERRERQALMERLRERRSDVSKHQFTPRKGDPTNGSQITPIGDPTKETQTQGGEITSDYGIPTIAQPETGPDLSMVTGEAPKGILPTAARGRGAIGGEIKKGGARDITFLPEDHRII